MRHDVVKKREIGSALNSYHFRQGLLEQPHQQVVVPQAMGHTLPTLKRGFAIDSLSTSSIRRVVLDDLYGGFVSSARETSSVERRLDALDANGAR
jgi:hypothetical protein